RQRVFFELPREIPGVDLREREQLQLLRVMQGYYAQQPFAERRSDGMLYCFQNDQFCHCDAIMLYGMLRHSQPRRVIEVGSGHSSCAIADTNRLAKPSARTDKRPHKVVVTASSKGTHH